MEDETVNPNTRSLILPHYCLPSAIPPNSTEMYMSDSK